MDRESIIRQGSVADPSAAVSLTALQAGHEDSLSQFFIQLAQFGFVKVSLGPGARLDALTEGIRIGKSMGRFRFPPVGESVVYAKEHRDCFHALYSLSRACLSWILSGVDAETAETRFLGQRLGEAHGNVASLFAPDGQGHAPFADTEQAFGSSFFNIFDYDYGLLNAHKDRYLVTTIFADSDPATADQRSVLWVRGLTGRWHSVDAHLGSNEVVFMIGEELEEILGPLNLQLYAAEHCIRVDPDGEFLSRSHFRADPATAPSGNRLSTAFILGEPGLA